MKINIKNFYCIEALIESNPKIIEFINIPNPKDKKISELTVNAKQSGIKILNKSNPPFYKWYEDGTTNTCYNALDLHIDQGKGAPLP